MYDFFLFPGKPYMALISERKVRMSEINLLEVGSLNLNFNQADPKKA